MLKYLSTAQTVGNVHVHVHITIKQCMTMELRSMVMFLFCIVTSPFLTFHIVPCATVQYGPGYMMVHCTYCVTIVAQIEPIILIQSPMECTMQIVFV